METKLQQEFNQLTPHFHPVNLESCSLFGTSTIGIDFLLSIVLFECLILRLYYSFRFPYGIFQRGTELFSVFRRLIFGDTKNREKKKDDSSVFVQTKTRHEEKYVESIWSFLFVSCSLEFAIVSILAYFRIDKFLITQSSDTYYIIPYIYQFSEFIICFGDITFISRDTSLVVFFRVIGLIVLQYSCVFLFWVHQEMKTSWTPFIHLKQDHKLVTSGPFQIVRHPMYYSFFLIGVGVGISSWNWFIALVWFISFCSTVLRIPIEEKLLIETYGDEYQKYRATTKYAVIPFVY